MTPASVRFVTLSERYICQSIRNPTTFPRRNSQPIHAAPALHLPRRRRFFTSSVSFNQQSTDTSSPGNATNPENKRKSSRSQAAKTSLRRAALEAERSRDLPTAKPKVGERATAAKLVTAYAVAEQFDLAKVNDILRANGYEPDPLKTHLYPQVTHIAVPLSRTHPSWTVATQDAPSSEVGDIFIFPSGTVVTWSLPEGFTSFFATRTLTPAAEKPLGDDIETENMEFVEDPAKDHSSIKGDTIVLGTKSNTSPSFSEKSRLVNTVLTKIAFSSGLARSTKLAVLESLLADYIDSTRSIPTLLSAGSRLPFTRSFILRKTGQLLSFRAQLNLYSELTDSLPDLFWDSRSELGLEGCYDQVGRALDVRIRIKTLNEKMDYAQEIASVLRERLSEKHGLVLEWTIITLIAVEVGFEIMRLWKERKQELRERAMIDSA
ncbi:MAG: hypothetical protein Q9160_001176 [Pyrenula sp. 1 TL-2023]